MWTPPPPGKCNNCLADRSHSFPPKTTQFQVTRYVRNHMMRSTQVPAYEESEGWSYPYLTDWRCTLQWNSILVSTGKVLCTNTLLLLDLMGSISKKLIYFIWTWMIHLVGFWERALIPGLKGFMGVADLSPWDSQTIKKNISWEIDCCYFHLFCIPIV